MFFRVDNFATVRDKVFDKSKVSKFCLEKD